MDNDCDGEANFDAAGEVDLDGDDSVSCEDCDDEDDASTIKAEDGDCDGVITADDCDDNEPNAWTTDWEVEGDNLDANCDGVYKL